MSKINAYDSGLRYLELKLNGESVGYTEMRPQYTKDIVVKKGDILELIGVSSEYGTENKIFELFVTDKILSHSRYHLNYVKELFKQGEVDFFDV